jgi:hypothetical protein
LNQAIGERWAGAAGLDGKARRSVMLIDVVTEFLARQDG